MPAKNRKAPTRQGKHGRTTAKVASVKKPRGQSAKRYGRSKGDNA